jgi:hypothetical protein
MADEKEQEKKAEEVKTLPVAESETAGAGAKNPRSGRDE